MEFAAAKQHDVLVSAPSLIKQTVQNIKHPLDLVREALSNSCAAEVKARKVILTIYKHPEYGATFDFYDDGMGMDWTGCKEGPQQGRLDRFLNLGFSGVIGVPADEFGWKGLGAKLMYWCRLLTIETISSATQKRYKVDVLDPMSALDQATPRLPEPQVAEFPVPSDKPSFTKITVYGYDGGRWKRDYNFDRLKVYLFHRSIVGCTREGRTSKLPDISVKHPDLTSGEETLSPGYRFIKPSPKGGWRTVVIDPITVKEPTDDGKDAVSVTLKGGFTLDTGDTGSEFSLTPGNLNTGVNVSVLGIPYFSLEFGDFRGDFRPASKLCNFVVECDTLNLNIERSWYVADTKSRAFEAACRKSIAKVKELPAYQAWVENVEKLRREELSESLNDRKQKLQNASQNWVYVDGKVVHVEPGNEKDTLAVLWKLEAMAKLPFQFFVSLQHTALEGIDLICDYQETKESQKHILESIEVEYKLQNYLDHAHVATQTGLIFCWEAKPDPSLKRISDWKFLWQVQGAVVPVYVIGKFPGIEVKPKV